MNNLLQTQFKIGGGVCQAMLGNNIYDLTKFDVVGRDTYYDTPSVIESTDKTSAFVYKTCEPGYTMTEK
jgi:hypothetical protein